MSATCKKLTDLSAKNSREIAPHSALSTTYHDYGKPKLQQLLAALGLDVDYHRAAGNYVYRDRYDSGQREERAVLDMVGGFGAALLGHNPAHLKAHLMTALLQDTPAFVQCGIPGKSAQLCKKMNACLPGDGRYYGTIVNSGAEAVEATIKHAYKVRLDAVRRAFETISRRVQDIYDLLDTETVAAAIPEEFSDLENFRDRIDEHNLQQYEHFQRHPVVCALKGAFHGKTTAALKMTFNKSYREGFEGLSAIITIFFEREQPQQLPEIIARERIEFLLPEIIDGELQLTTKPLTTVFAVILEIIQGEGGVRPLSEETLQTLANLHATLEVPYIIDEIQTGCGRTGAIAAYGQTPLSAIEPEYLVFGKALGGGMVKIAMAMIHEKVYDPDFGLLHTSTFAEDDISSSVALATLDLLTDNDNRLLNSAGTKGNYLLRRLRELQQKYPLIIGDVRGRGLMIGMELTPLADYGAFFRYAGSNGFISLLMASYLLHHHDVRVIAPLATLFKGNPGKMRPGILRIQPPLTITRAEIDHLVAALDDTLNIIDKNNEFFLIAHLIGEHPSRDEFRSMPIVNRTAGEMVQFDARVGFIVHITRLEYLIDYYLPSFRHYDWDRDRLKAWWNRLSRFLEPELVHRAYVASDGFVVEANIVFVPYLAEQMVRTFQQGRNEHAPRTARLALQEMRERIQDAALIARDLGDERIPTTIVGLGAFNSIITDNGRTMNDFEIPVTTGNAYTTALLLQGIEKAAAERQLPLGNVRAAVIGAGGNIGSALAMMLCFRVAELRLIGRDTPQSTAKLVNTRYECLAEILRDIQVALKSGHASGDIEMGGLAGEIYRQVLRPALDAPGDASPAMKKLTRHLDENSDLHEAAILLDEAICHQYQVEQNPFISITSMDSLGDCQVVTIATNDTDARLVNPQRVRPGAIVASASVPSNLSSEFRAHPDDYTVFDGGLTCLPEDSCIDFIGMPGNGMAFGCLGETLLVGFEGSNRSFVKGKLGREQINETLMLAERYHFHLGDFTLNGQVLDEKPAACPVQ